MDQLGEAIGGVGNVLGGVGGEIGKDIGAVGNTLGQWGSGALQGVEGMFGMGKGAGATAAPAGPMGTAVSSGAMPSVPSITAGGAGAGTSAGALAGLDPGSINAGRADLSSAIGAGGGSTAPVGTNVAPSLMDTSGIGADMHAATLPTVTPGHGGVADFAQSLLSPKGVGGLLETAMIGRDLLSPKPPQLKQLQGLASEAQGQAKLAGNLAQGGQQGQIPQAMQASIDQALQKRIASIRQEYASAGMSGSSAEKADIAAAQQDAVTQQWQIASQLMQTGLATMNQDMGQAAQFLQQAMAIDAAQGTELGSDIANFAGLLANRPLASTVH